jgi:hypothetical protein
MRLHSPAILFAPQCAYAKQEAPCGRSSAVERQLPKLDVVGSIPIARSNLFNDLAGNSASEFRV